MPTIFHQNDLDQNMKSHEYSFVYDEAQDGN